MGLKEEYKEDHASQDSIPMEKVSERPLYHWLKSFAVKEIGDEADLSQVVSSNALTYALEYIGITSENEQSSLHLSAIFDEEGQQTKNKFPNHYESETKSKIQNLNRIFLEVKSFFEDRFSQLVAIKPPNSVHIVSSCSHCSVDEFEKLLFLVLGAAIQGTQKQDTIQKIKRFPSRIQEALIECIKSIADNPELLNVKSWQEFMTLEKDTQKKVYESMLTLIRKLIIERNELAQNQLLSDYFCGYVNCDQKRVHEMRGFTLFCDFEKIDDSKVNSSMRYLREQLTEKSELLQECREELEAARNRIQDLELEVNEMKYKQRTMKKTRDELDALREGHDKASRLEAELAKMKAKLEETEHIYDRVETLEIENRNWQIKHDMLLDQISFLSLEKTSRENSFDPLNAVNGVLDNLGHSYTYKDDYKFFYSDDEEPSVKENAKTTESTNKQQSNDSKTVSDGESTVQSQNTNDENLKNKEEVVIERPGELEISQSEFIDVSGENLVASTPKGAMDCENEKNHQTLPSYNRTKRRRRSSILSMKRTRKAIIIPVLSSNKVQSAALDKLSETVQKGKITSQTIQLFKMYNVSRRRGSTRPRKFKNKLQLSESEKQVVPNIDNEEHDADEELSISPACHPRESDLDSHNDNPNGTDNDSEVYFVCSPQNSTGTTTPKRAHHGTTTAFPVFGCHGNDSSQQDNRVTSNLSHMDVVTLEPPVNEIQSNHLTIYAREPTNRETPRESLTVPLMKISHEIQLQQSDESDEPARIRDDTDNAFTFGNYNIRMNLRNTNVKPATALINKISPLSTNVVHDHNFNHQYSTAPRNQYVETSSEEDSIWYEYGCV